MPTLLTVFFSAIHSDQNFVMKQKKQLFHTNIIYAIRIVQPSTLSQAENP